MIVDKNIEWYIDSLGSDIPEELMELERWAKKNSVPIIKRSTQGCLKFLLLERQPMSILEIGTAIGFSALFMEHYSPKGCRITTIEKVEKRLKEAKNNLKGHPDICLLEGEAFEILEDLASNHTERYDFIFLDAAKGQYPVFLKPIKKLMSPKGMLVTDNVLLEGTIAGSKFGIERRDRTIHKRMREYLYELTHSDGLYTVVLPVGDGISVTIHTGGCFEET